MEELSAKGLSIYNQFWMELEQLYSAYAKECGLSNCPFGIFCLLYENLGKLLFVFLIVLPHFIGITGVWWSTCLSQVICACIALLLKPRSDKLLL